ncbi:3'-5' exonuclease [Acetobacteraceae bacterium KSS8]|uniref:3'-5' exonuclease n=1 Tax=Endosaccharibacter trunci TaxID=2812733 RepID=A0ABT1WB39_9PROT|nr:3'-5' exonuclease [Acetobacteraceae bacterium KSS8]
MTSSDHLETLAQTLEATGDYRIIRRLKPRPRASPPPGTPVRLGLLVDVETTGLDPQRDEIIELAMTPFSYGLDGTVFSVEEGFQRLRQPSEPITPEITAITRITNEMVAGQVIDPAEVARFAAPASLVIAHNAAFDRRFLERFSDAFTTKPWACSLSQIDWAAEGFEGVKLAYLAQAGGFFYDRHRAMHDCLATIELLAMRLPRSGVTGLSRLLDSARAVSWRIWAENSPFDLKDVLKARGYRWNGDSGPQPRAWYIDVSEAQREAELRFLRMEIYRHEIDPPVRRIDAYDRFSDRI